MPAPFQASEQFSIERYITALSAAATVFAQRAAQGNAFSIGKEETCRSMARYLQRRGAFASGRQKDYADKLIRWSQPSDATARHILATNPEAAARHAAEAPQRFAAERPATPVITPAAITRIATLFRTAREHGIQRPKIVVRVGSVLLTLKPSRIGHLPESVYVYANNRADWIATIITATGEIRPRAIFRAEHASAMQAFGDDPLRIAAAHGHATGNCCFCRRHLTDARSVAMGYGPICAEHFGLEWGASREVANAVVMDEHGRTAISSTLNITDAPSITVPLRITLINDGVTDNTSAMRSQLSATERARLDREQQRAALARATRPTRLHQPEDPTDEDSHFM